MEVTIGDILMVLWSGAAMTMFGTVIGGVLVFRTRRDSHESLFAPKSAKEDDIAINLDDFANSFTQEEETEEDLTPDLFGAKNREFLRQLTERRTQARAGEEPESEKGA